jgi:hypothetical protein
MDFHGLELKINIRYLPLLGQYLFSSYPFYHVTVCFVVLCGTKIQKTNLSGLWTVALKQLNNKLRTLDLVCTPIKQGSLDQHAVDVSLSFDFSNQLNNFQEIWYKPYASGSYLNRVIFNFLQTWWTYELGRYNRH